MEDFPQGIDYLITGIGTGGHITGISQLMKEKFPAFKAFAVEPSLSPVISGGNPGPHPLQGIGAGFIPDVLKTELLDGIILVENDKAFEFTKRLALEEGILGGISTGTSLAAVASKLDELESDKIILTFNYDTGERYWSVDNLF